MRLARGPRLEPETQHVEKWCLRPGIRTAPPRAAAGRRSAGSTMGRPPKLTDAQKVEARRRRAQGRTLAELARS
jgi:hypothetical protein